MTRGTVVALVGLWVHLLGVATLGAQVSVEELEVHLQLRRDTAALTQVIPVRNEETRAQQVRITMGDWVRDAFGSNQFLAANSTPNACGQRLQVFPSTFQVAPGATEIVRVTYSPAPADTGCWAIAFVETVQPPVPRPDDVAVRSPLRPPAGWLVPGLSVRSPVARAGPRPAARPLELPDPAPGPCPG